MKFNTSIKYWIYRILKNRHPVSGLTDPLMYGGETRILRTIKPEISYPFCSIKKPLFQAKFSQRKGCSALRYLGKWRGRSTQTPMGYLLWFMISKRSNSINIGLYSNNQSDIKVFAICASQHKIIVVIKKRLASRLCHPISRIAEKV